MSPRNNPLDEEIRELYAAPLASFIAERNALASRLKKEKDRAAAEEVTALRKPPPSAWAVNRLFQQEPKRMAELLDAGEQARKALHEAITSGGAGSLRSAIQEARELIEELRRRALELLTADGQTASDAMGERIGTNLQSLTFTPAAAETAKRGWLDADLDPPGFEVLAGLQVAAGADRPRPERVAREAPPIRPRDAAAPPKETRKAEEPAREKAHAPSRKEREETRLREWREGEEKRLRAEREREEARLRERLEAAEKEAEEAADEAAAREEEAESAEKAAAAARKEAERARAAAERAADVLTRAREALAEAQQGGKVLAHPGAKGRRK